MKKSTEKSLMEFNAVYKENDEIYRSASKRLGVSDCALWILYNLLIQEEPVIQREICDAFFYPKQTVNSALKKLEGEGYIKMSEMKDRRSKQIVLTEIGEKLAENTAGKLMKAEIRAISGLTDDEKEEFIRIFKKYNNLLKKNFS